MASDPRPRISPDEYLALERQAETKSEYLDGEIFAMTGASRRHNRIGLNVAFTLDSQLKARGREVYAIDMRVRVSATGLYTYPDVTVVCGEPQFEDAEVDTLLNPKVVIEVLSKSTEDYDRGTKFLHYRALPSLAEYLLVAQDRVHVEHYVRQNDSWVLTETDRVEDVIELPSVGARLALADAYDRAL
jgi:Uma2 family endonuclease